MFKKYHAQIYGAVKASLHVTTTAPHGGAVGLPPYYSHWIVDWLDTRAARTPCRTEPEHFSQLASNYATRRHHKLHVLQLNVRMSLLAILSHANPLYTLTPYFYYYYYYYYYHHHHHRYYYCYYYHYYYVVLLQAYTFFIRTMQAICSVEIFPSTLPRLSQVIHCVGRVYGADGAYAAALKTTTHPKTRCRKPYAATQRLMLLMMGVCARNMSS